MTRKLKTLGIALVAVLALGSVAASAASAANDDFVADSAPVTLTGNQHNGKIKFILAGLAVECTTATVDAAVSNTTVTEVTTLEPTYHGCTWGNQPATVAPNGCTYILTGTTDAAGDAQAKVECEGQIALTLNAAKCLVTVGTQTATEGYTITTTGTGTTKELTLHITAKVDVTSHAHPTHGITCMSLTKGTGTLEGTFTVTGEHPDSGTHIGITEETTK